MSVGATRRGALALTVGAAVSACTPAGPVDLPQEALPGLDGLMRGGWPVPGIGERQFLGRVSLLNVWASWCPYCRGEHDLLMQLARDGRFSLVGLVYQDKAEKAAAYLKQAGNPFDAVSVDRGRFAEALGQRGVPGSYVVDRRGRVALAIRGALSEGSIRGEVVPAIKASLNG